MNNEKKQLPKILLPDGSYMPKMGQGTWKMGEDDEKFQREVDGLKYGMSIGFEMIDTAEMYGEGKAENVVGHAIRGEDRSRLYLVSKVYPQNANRKHIYSSLDRSMKLMETDYLEMYILHWREDADLSEVVYCMEDLKDKGRIKRWGVSNFDVADLEDLWKVPDGDKCCVNQVLYNLGSRGIEYDLLPWQREKGLPVMAYGPAGRAGDLVTQDGVSKASLMTDKNVAAVAKKHDASIVQILLAFVLRQKDVIAIPKAVGKTHIDENIAAADIKLTEEDIEMLSASFPPPEDKVPMEKY